MNELPHKVSAVTPLNGPTLDGTPKRKRRRSPGTPPTVSQLTHVKVDPRVMAAVRRVIKQGVYNKVEIVDAETVIVR